MEKIDRLIRLLSEQGEYSLQLEQMYRQAMELAAAYREMSIGLLREYGELCRTVAELVDGDS